MERCGKMSRLQWQMQSFLYFLAKEFASFVHKLIELDPVRLWFDLCRDTHHFCVPKKPAHTSLPSFRVVDCTKTPQVVEERS